MITADQLVAHAVGDYLLQSDWMASEKVKQSAACLAHVATYFLPFLLITRSVAALAVIVGTHFVIDRWRLARFVCWAKNWIAPPGNNDAWRDCTGTGYADSKPAWMAVWLMIIADNSMHVIANGVALRLWG